MRVLVHSPFAVEIAAVAIIGVLVVILAAALGAVYRAGDTNRGGRVSLVLIGALGVGVVVVAMGLNAMTDRGASYRCKDRDPKAVDAKGAPRWRLIAPKHGAIRISLDDYVKVMRTGRGFVRVRPLASAGATPGRATPRRTKAKGKGATGLSSQLPAKHPVAAYLLSGTVNDGKRDIGIRITAHASRAPDGSTVTVTTCAYRGSDRAAARPGRYKGRVRVTGDQVRPAELPIVVTIKAARTELIIGAALLALLGAALSAANNRTAQDPPQPARTAAGAGKPAAVAEGSRPTATPDPGKVGTQPHSSDLLDHLASVGPLVAGLLAGLSAAMIVYFDDPTFGANRAADTAKMLTAAFAGATGGETLASPVARAAKRKIRSKST